jgi:UDP-glucuronate 4-epimerase
MKILVTGAAGFIGSHLAEKLVDLGHTVVGLDCFTDYYPRILKEQNAGDIKSKGVELLELDLSEDDLAGAVEGVDVVYHLAAQPGISSKVSFETYVKNNIVATERLLKAVENSPSLKLFVNVCTSSVYGALATVPETAEPKPTSYYGVTKLAAEQLVLARQRDKRFPGCSVRLFSVYGERERPEKLYPLLIKSILTGKSFPLFEGSDKHLRSYTYVGDIVKGLLSLLTSPQEYVGEIFNLGLDTTMTTGEGIKIVEEIIGEPARIETKPKRAGDQLKTQAIIDKARKFLNYDPSTHPREGLEKVVEWYKEKIMPLINEGKYGNES